MRAFAASLAEMWSSSRMRARPSPEEAAVERLLARQRLERGAPASQRTLELVLTAAAGPATERELAGEAAAVTAFLTVRARQGRARWHAPRRIPVLTAAVLLVAILALAGTAEAGALPAPLQRLAHRTIDAPAPTQLPAPAPTAHVTPGPGATGTTSAPASSQTGQPSTTPTPTTSSSTKSHGNGQGNGNGHGKAKGKDKNKDNGQGNS